MDGKLGPKRRLLTVIFILSFLFVRGEIYGSFYSLPIKGKIYVRDGSHSQWWLEDFFCYPKYVRIARTEDYSYLKSAISSPSASFKEVYFKDAEDAWIEHDTSWEDFNLKYNERNLYE